MIQQPVICLYETKACHIFDYKKQWSAIQVNYMIELVQNFFFCSKIFYANLAS